LLGVRWKDVVKVPLGSFKNIVEGSPLVNYILELLVKYILFNFKGFRFLRNRLAITTILISRVIVIFSCCFTGVKTLREPLVGTVILAFAITTARAFGTPWLQYCK